MALRRKLPSRMTPDSAPESVATPEKSENSSPRRESSAQSSAPVNAVPEAAPVTTSHADTFAAASASAFGTVGTARVLEDSFTAAPAPEPTPAPQPEFIAPAWDAPAAPLPEVKAEEPAFSAPAWDAPAAPAIEAAPMPATEPAFSAPAWDAPQAEAKPESTPAPQPEVKIEEPAFSAPAWDAPAITQPEAKTEEPAFSAPAWDAPAAPQHEVKAEEPAFSAPAWETPAAPSIEAAPAVQPEVKPEPAPEPVAEAAPQAGQVTDFMPTNNPASANFQPSRPDNNSRRRVREKRPRDFTAMGAPENQPAERNKPTVAFAANVPVNTKTLDKVDEDLIASGIMAPPPADSLTSSLPSGAAESTYTPSPLEDLPAPAPITQSTPVAAATPAPAPEPVVQAAPEPKPEPKFEPKPEIKPEPLPQPAPQPAAAPVLPEVKPYVPRELPDEPELTDATPAAAPAFTLSNQPKASEPLPPPQSDLPWTQPQASAEWEIETPQADTWHPDAAPATPSTSHMPQPGDLYGSMGNGPSAPVPPFAAPPRPSANFTPEIPAQRRRQAGTPWALVAVGVVVAAGAGAWYITQGGSQQAQQQLASLTSPRQDADAQGTQPDGMLAPPTTDGNGASFYTPPLASDVSSSSVVNFADVPADQANQPIVADGTEQPPEGMGLFDRLNDSIDKARAEKQGAQTANVSGTAPAGEPSQASTDAALNRQKLNEELAAYRSALAQSGNPSELTPASFRKDPEGFMDGKVPATNPDAILPAPGASQANILPPPDLYTNNPSNLPVVAEPVAGVAQRVRTLADFPDVEAYMPEREKVEIPKNLKPKMAATDFPSLEVLSFVPGKGIVAFADGREGVLLIGESINGWELVGVSPDNAEFKTGQRSHQVTAEN